MSKIYIFLYHIYIFLFKNNRDYVKLFWFNKEQNFGDSINPYIVEKISKKKVIWISPKFAFETTYLCIGSIMQNSRKNSIIWGSGFISSNPRKIRKHKKICAVRGPKSRKVYTDNGIECPEVYGDPALLLPRFHTSNVEKKYKIGIIPHYVDKTSPWLDSFTDNQEIKIIDIQQSDPLKFIDELNECETIISSSLHGLIVADAYNVPSIWIQFSDKVVGNNFKFYDYFESVGRTNEEVIFITKHTSIEDIINLQKKYTIKIDLDKLMQACPFLDNNEKQ